MIAPAAKMISSWLIPADSRKTTFSDGRRQEGGFAVGTNAKKVASRALRGVFFSPDKQNGNPG
jgi:hypothetical protein